MIALADAFVSRALERRTLHVGSFLTALALFAGIELYGFTGAVLLLLGVILGVAVVAEIDPEEVAETLLAPLAGVEDAEAPAVPEPRRRPRPWRGG